MATPLSTHSAERLHGCEAQTGAAPVAAEGPGIAHKGLPQQAPHAKELQKLLAHLFLPKLPFQALTFIWLRPPEKCPVMIHSFKTQPRKINNVLKQMEVKQTSQARIPSIVLQTLHKPNPP